MKIAITGARSMGTVKGDLDLALWVFDDYQISTEFLVGGAKGADTIMASIAYNAGYRVTLYAPAAPYNIKCEKFAHHVLACPMSAEPYRTRNEMLVRDADFVIAFPEFEESDGRSKRSGTWMTIRMARKARKIFGCDIHVLRRIA